MKTCVQILACAIFLVLIFFSATVTVDNVVPNGGFEDGSIPRGISQLKKANGWKSGGKGTPDYYSPYSPPGGVGVPSNGIGSQDAVEGERYAGLGYFSAISREYIQCKLTGSLDSAAVYRFTAQISLADKSTHYISEIDCAITENRLKSRTWERIPCDSASIVRCVQDTGYKDHEVWVEITGEYLAKGGEKYLTIGWFRPEEIMYSMPYGANMRGSKRAYYYIDDVQLVKVQ